MRDLRKDEMYIVIVYDKVAEESSNLMMIKNFNLLERMFKASVQPADMRDYTIYILGIYNTHDLSFEVYKEEVDMEPIYKALSPKSAKLAIGAINETSK